MKRWPLRILPCLILITGGAITTVAVAWGAATWARNSNWAPDKVRVMPPTQTFISWWDRNVPPDWRRPPRGYIESREPGSVRMMGTEFSEEEFEVRRTLGNNATRDIAGWPCGALSGAFFTDRASRTTKSESLVTVRRNWLLPGSLIPVAIEPVGFVIDTLFYAAIWGALYFGFTSAKRFIRAKRGRCPRCGYDLRGAQKNGCSECGWNREGAEA